MIVTRRCHGFIQRFARTNMVIIKKQTAKQ